MKPGDTFLYAFPHEKKHLIIIVCSSESDESQENTLHCVYATTLRLTGYEDTACILHPGDHSFITHDSYIDYSKMLHVKDLYLQECFNRGAAQIKEAVSTEVLDRIKHGALHSDAIRQNNTRYFI